MRELIQATMYNPQIQQPQYYQQLYGASSSTMSTPYYYGYSVQAPRNAFSSPQANRLSPGPSYLYYPTPMEVSFSGYRPPQQTPMRQTFASPNGTFNSLMFFISFNYYWSYNYYYFFQLLIFHTYTHGARVRWETEMHTHRDLWIMMHSLTHNIYYDLAAIYMAIIGVHMGNHRAMWMSCLGCAMNRMMYNGSMWKVMTEGERVIV